MNRKSEAKMLFPEVPEDTVDLLFDRCPNKGAYGRWMVTQVAAGESVRRAVNAVKAFHEKKVRLPPGKRDLYRFETITGLRAELKKIGASKRKRKRADPGYTKVLTSGDVVFYHCKTAKGMQVLGRDTQWCITNAQTWKNYTEGRGGKMFVVAHVTSRGRRDAFAKFAIEIIGSRDSALFSPWRRLRELRIASNIEINVYDANDRQAYFSRTLGENEQRSPNEELIGIHAKETNVVDRVVDMVAGVARPDNLRPLLKTIQGPFCNRERVLDVAREFKRTGYINPLSLMGHPRLLSASAAQALFEIAGPESMEQLLPVEMRNLLSETHAVNVPEMLAFFWKKRGYVGGRTEAVAAILNNQKATVATRKQLLADVASKILRIQVEIQELSPAKRKRK